MVEEVAEKLNDINITLQKMLRFMRKPDDTFKKTFEKIVLVVGVFEIINIADVIRQWIIGG
jgi:hypothetical protein